MQPISFHYDFENSLLKRNKYTEGHFVINLVDYVMLLSVPIKSDIQTNYDMSRRLLFMLHFCAAYLNIFWFVFWIFFKN